MQETRKLLRVALATLILLSAVQTSVAYVTNDTRDQVSAYERQSELPVSDRPQVTDQRQNMTVIAGLESNIRDTHALYAFGPDGRLRYYDTTHSYGDVDPSPAGAQTVMVVRHDLRGTNDCEGPCTRQAIVRVNLSTGENETIWSRLTPEGRVVRWHDIDPVGTTDSYLIADIGSDSVRRVNASTNVVEWAWYAEVAYNPRTTGGPFPGDWTHLNDVERLPDGRIMLSLRNLDRVVFVDPAEGLQRNWTLGAEDEWGTIFEQHNPDYIPEKNGGPAILVSDSENNRVVEYQRRNGSWEQTWHWQDDQLNWPRDADRLPNGHTLITDSHGNRVLEINRDGEIVWSTSVRNPYEAERLGTGDESAGGPSAVAANLTSRGPDDPRGATGTFPGANEAEGQLTKLWHAIQFVTPLWMTVKVIGYLLLGTTATVVLLLFELYWRGLRLRLPVTRQRGELP